MMSCRSVYARVAGTEVGLLEKLRGLWPLSTPAVKYELLTGQQMITGDVILGFKTEGEVEEPWVYLERKTRCDLMASLNDGRYRQQTNRLHALRQQSDVAVGYIIEDSNPPSVSANPLYHQVLFSIRAKHRMMMEQTPNTEKSAELIIRWMLKLSDHKVFWEQTNKNTQSQKLLLGATGSIKTKDFSNADEELSASSIQYLKLLRTLVPVNKSTTIFHHYPTWQDLHRSWKLHPKPEKMLAELDGHPSRIGTKISAQVYEALRTDSNE